MEHHRRAGERCHHSPHAAPEQQGARFARGYHRDDCCRFAAPALWHSHFRRDHRRPFQHQLGTARCLCAPSVVGCSQVARCACSHHCRARSHRVAPLSHRCRRRDGRPPRLQHRAYRSGTCQHCFATLRRNTCHWCHSPNHGQHHRRRTHTRGWHHTCRRAAAHLPVPHAPGPLHSYGVSGRCARRCVLRYERLALVQGTHAQPQERCHCALANLLPHNHLRPDHSHRGGTHLCLPALHAPDGRNHRGEGYPRRDRPQRRCRHGTRKPRTSDHT